jgi:phenylpyruvate tautomerase PptA (4-oxalocrotonate tautomerase family)
MPLVEIYVSQNRPPEQRRKLADALHRAVVETVGIPENDRFQIVRALAPAEYVADPSYAQQQRSADFLVVRITLRGGRPPEKKRALYRAIADRAAEAVGIRGDDVLIALHENDSIDWSFGAGIAQYAPT